MISSEQLPHVNAALNGIAGLLLIIGFVMITQGRVRAHRNAMLGAFGVSTVFLVCYLIYHYTAGHVSFPDYPPNLVRKLYYGMLASHIVLAMAVPPLAVVTIWLGLRDRREAHRRIARWTLPIWLYVSITGVLVYLMLYQLYPPRPRNGPENAPGAPAAAFPTIGVARDRVASAGCSLPTPTRSV